MKKKSWKLSAALLSSLMLLSACGGGGTSSASSSAAEQVAENIAENITEIRTTKVKASETACAARAAIETNNDRIAELKAVIGEGKTGDDTVIVDDGPIVDGPVAQPTEEDTQADFAEEETAAPKQPEEAPKTEE